MTYQEITRAVRQIVASKWSYCPDPDSLVGETLLSIAKSGREPSYFKPGRLAQAVRWRAIDQLRVYGKYDRMGVDRPTIVNMDNCVEPSHTPDYDSSAYCEWLLSALFGRDETVIRKYYFEDLTLEEIGKKLHVSRERVRQIRECSLRKIRQHASQWRLLKRSSKKKQSVADSLRIWRASLEQRKEVLEKALAECDSQLEYFTGDQPLASQEQRCLNGHA